MSHGLAQMMQLPALETAVICAFALNEFGSILENIECTLTKDELKIILKEYVMAGELMYHTKWALEKQIKDATSIEELNAIKIEFPHADFSK